MRRTPSKTLELGRRVVSPTRRVRIVLNIESLDSIWCRNVVYFIFAGGGFVVIFAGGGLVVLRHFPFVWNR